MVSARAGTLPSLMRSSTIQSMKIPMARSFLLLFVALAPLLAEDALKYGQPACAGPVLDKTYFVACYDPQWKIPVWVGYALNRADVSAAVADRKEDGFQFHPDPTLRRGERAENADYAKSGYDKGHMAPAADFKRSVEAMKATFILTNAVPQKHGVNAGIWSQLEAAVRSLASNHGSVWVFSGPAFAGGKPMKTIGPHHVAVPTHTYKVILCAHPNGEKAMYAFLVPNVDKPKGKIGDYTVSVHQIETLVARDFFDALPQEEQARLERTAKILPVQ